MPLMLSSQQIGRVDQFDWVESPSFNIGKLLRNCPEAVLEKFVVITAFDSGPLRLSSEEIRKGWRAERNLVITSKITNCLELPFDDYDEWYTFPQFVLPKIAETFVNDGIFRLTSPDQFVRNAVAAVGAQADIVGAKYLASRLVERQLIFWDQLKECNAESFIAGGHTFMFASQNAGLFERVKKAVAISG